MNEQKLNPAISINSSSGIVPRHILWPFILITSCFAWWGLANNMTDTLLAAFKKIMSMSDFQTSWIQIAFYGSYFCLALPAALFIKKFTYKAGVLLGLGLFIGGALLFYPASLTMNYMHFLAALYVLAGGLCILETSANPYIIAMGPEETATRRLNLAQSFNPLGSIIGIILSKYFILANLNQANLGERASMTSNQLDLEERLEAAEQWNFDFSEFEREEPQSDVLEMDGSSTSPQGESRIFRARTALASCYIEVHPNHYQPHLQNCVQELLRSMAGLSGGSV